MHKNGKPVRKCHGCGLNFRDHCGIYASPHEKWHGHKRCRGYMNEELLEKYMAQQEQNKMQKRKEMRRIRARARRTEPHHNGNRHTALKVS